MPVKDVAGERGFDIVRRRIQIGKLDRRLDPDLRLAIGRLDGDGVACDHRRRDTLRRESGQPRMNQIDNTVALEATIRGATAALLDRQRDDGHWVFELEADATIPAEYVLLVHYLAETPNLELERKIGVYLRRIQGAHGGWPLYHEGAFDISATVKAYFALKMIGDDIEAPHMARARAALRTRWLHESRGESNGMR